MESRFRRIFSFVFLFWRFNVKQKERNVDTLIFVNCFWTVIIHECVRKKIRKQKSILLWCWFFLCFSIPKIRKYESIWFACLTKTEGTKIEWKISRYQTIIKLFIWWQHINYHFLLLFFWKLWWYRLTKQMIFAFRSLNKNSTYFAFFFFNFSFIYCFHSIVLYDAHSFPSFWITIRWKEKP